MSEEEKSRLAELIEEYGTTMYALSREAGIPKTTIRSLCNRGPKLQVKLIHAIRIVHYFDYKLKLTDLLSNEARKEIQPNALKKMGSTPDEAGLL